MSTESEKTRTSTRHSGGGKTGSRGSPFQEMGRRMDQATQEAEKLVAYLNDEVVPAVRRHSSSGLRKAAEKLSEFANYLDSKGRR